MFAKLTSRMTAAAVTALVLAASSASAAPSEVSSLKVTGEAPTTVKLNVTGLQRRVVRQMVRVAAVQVCTNAVQNRELFSGDGEWCVSATRDRTMARYNRLHAAFAHQLASGPETLALAFR
jgi:hypothetical protein